MPKGRKSTMRVLLTGGGTGGHVSPALAIAAEFEKEHPGTRFLYVGVRGKAEESMVPKAGLPLRFVSSAGFPGLGNPLAFLVFGLKVLAGTLKACLIVLSYRPRVVVATGGYVSAPVVFGAALLRSLRIVPAKIFIHEQNVTLGRLNALAARLADGVGVSFPGTLKQVPEGKGIYVGYPVREVVVDEERLEARERLGIPPEAKLVFAFGGSQGARTINRAVVDALPRLLSDPEVWVIHGTGRQLAGNPYDGEEDVRSRLESLPPLPELGHRYRRQAFFDDIGTYYAAADLVVCRAGAGTLTEVSAVGLPAVVIPKANLPGDHQVGNALALERAGAAEVLYERVALADGEAVEWVPGEELAEAVRDLLADPRRMEEMAHAAESFFDAGALSRIIRLVEHLSGLGDAPDSSVSTPPELGRIAGRDSNQLDHLLRAIRRGSQPALSRKERRLVHYKIDGFLSASSYVEQCRGCRMVGLAEYDERLEVLISFATARGGGGRYRRAPMVRRDAFVGLAGLGMLNEEVLGALRLGLGDSYFEARMAAADALTQLAKTDSDPGRYAELLERLVVLTSDRSFGPRISALRALGEVGMNDSELLPVFRRRYFDPVWKVRVALLSAFRRLFERGILDGETVRAEMDEILVTSSGFNLEFPLRTRFKELWQLVATLEDEAEAGGVL